MSKAAVRRTLMVSAELLVTCGVLVVLYTFWSLVVDDALVSHAQGREAAALEQRWDHRPVHPAGDSTGPAVPAPKRGEEFAVLRIPRFGGGWHRPVLEGTTLEELARGVGHYEGTAMPGQVGNFAVAGHRLTHGSAFTKIAELRTGDVIGVRTPTAWYLYRVTSSEIVAPDRMDVIAPVPGRVGQAPTEPQLTLTSCHPLYGSSKRYVVRATLVRTEAADGGVPAELRRPA